MLPDVEKLKYELIKYNTLKGNISVIINLLENTVNSYEEISKSLYDTYLIDNEQTAVYEKATKIESEIADTSKKLKNVILPKINSKIYSLRKEIIDCE